MKVGEYGKSRINTEDTESTEGTERKKKERFLATLGMTAFGGSAKDDEDD